MHRPKAHQLPTLIDPFAPVGSAALPLPKDAEAPGNGPAPEAPPRDSAAERAALLRRERARQLEGVFAALEEGRLRRAFELAQRADWKRVVVNASAGRLVTLADAARFSGQQELARSTYRLARERAEGSTAASRAAFALGQLAFGSRDYADAAEWFGRYLAESPRGRLTEVALGRRLEALARGGYVARSCAAARDYVAHAKGGVHRPLAERVLRACHRSRGTTDE